LNRKNRVCDDLLRWYTGNQFCRKFGGFGSSKSRPPHSGGTYPTGGGTIDAGSQDVTLSFDCGLLPQDSVGTLRLTSNDPCAESTDINLALYCNSSSVIFADGFESGSAGSWSSTVP
jgi:hypothetical protein